MSRYRWIACCLALLGMLAAGASAAPASAGIVDAGAAIAVASEIPAAPEQEGVKLGLATGSAPGCVELPAGEPARLACTVVVGQAFQLPLSGWAFGSDANGALPLELTVEPLPAGASLSRLLAGAPQPGPVRGEGRVDARFDFNPGAEQITAPDAPLSLHFRVRPDGIAGEAQLELQLLVLDGSPGTLVAGYVYGDEDANGAWTQGEAGLAGWQVQLDGPTQLQAPSGADGRFAFNVTVAGSYRLRLLPQAGWLPSTPVEVPLEIDAAGGASPLVLFGQRQATQQPALSGELRSDRGCLDLGQTATYAVGETVGISLRVGGAPQAAVQLWLDMPDGGSRLLVARQLITGGRWYGLEGRAGLPIGVRGMRLEVFPAEGSSSSPVQTVRCGYTVGAVRGPSLGVEPERLAFPDTASGATARLPLAIHNVGTEPLQIYALGIQGGAGSPFGVDPQDGSGFGLPPGASRSVDLSFAPQWEGSFQDTLVVQSNDPSRPVLGLPLQGQTPGSVGLVARLATDRGCVETGQNPVYFDGDPIEVRYRADGPAGSAVATLEDHLPGGAVRTLLRRTIATGLDQVYASRVSPPIGTELLRLTVEAGGFSSEASCSFQVAGGASRIVIWKFADLDGDGIWDGKPEPGSPPLPGSEPPVPGWTMSLVGPETRTGVTDADGRLELSVSQPGSYVVSEVQGPGWRPTTPTSVNLSVWGTPGEVLPEIRFGNQPVDGVPTATAAPGTPAVSPTPAAPSATPTSGPSSTPLPTAEPGADCVSRGDWTRLPLGGSVTANGSPACLQVYLPTRWGGSLQLAAGAGRIWLYGPGVDPAGGSPLVQPARQLSYEAGHDQQGWYKLVLRDAPAGGHNVQARFVQSGQADQVPWNFWYFPYSPYAPGPKLYDPSGAFARYDSRFGLSPGAWRYEYDEHRSTQAEGWWGHCWGASVASILLEQPRAAAGFSQDELEGMAADFFDGFGALALEWDWPHVKPSPGFGDQADWYADNFHARLREYLRDRRVPLHMNLRQETGVGSSQVWNHAVYKYSAEFVEDPEAVGDPWVDKPRQLRIRTVITANEDFYQNGASGGTPEDGPRREQEAVYSLVYGPAGDIVPDATQPRPQNWRSLTLLSGGGRAGTPLYIPSGITDVRPAASYWTGASSPTGRNPYVDSQRLGALGLRKRY